MSELKESVGKTEKLKFRCMTPSLYRLKEDLVQKLFLSSLKRSSFQDFVLGIRTNLSPSRIFAPFQNAYDSTID